MNTRSANGLSLVLGLWLGATVAVLGVVAWNFAGIPYALEANDKLRDRLAFDVGDRVARRAQPIFVYSGELNRHILYAWNRAQLALGAVALWMAIRRQPRTSLLLALIAAGGLVVVTTFLLAPEIESIGRSIDFVSESPADTRFTRFAMLHRGYIIVEAVKTSLIALAAVLTARPRRDRR